jgi:hypothetical protein
VCLENVVLRDGAAAALLDFDFAAPGRPVYDLARCALMCVPVDDEISAARLGWHPAARPARLRLVADSYGLDAAARRQLVDVLAGLVARGGEFVRRRVEAGDPNFIRCGMRWAARAGSTAPPLVGCAAPGLARCGEPALSGAASGYVRQATMRRVVDRERGCLRQMMYRRIMLPCSSWWRGRCHPARSTAAR